MKAPSSTLNRNSPPLRPKRRDPESGLMESHDTDRPYDYESLFRASRQAPPHTTTSPSCIIDVGGPKARKYRDSSDPRRHKSPALSLRPPQVISRLPRQNAPATYPYDAWPVSLWPSRDPIEEVGGINLYGMVRNNAISFVDRLGLISAADANAALGKDGKDCGCYKIKSNFSKYEAFARKDGSFQVNGASVKLSLEAVAQPDKTVNGKKCVCSCKNVKVIQFASSSANSVMLNWRRNRTADVTGPNRENWGSWRIDGAKGGDGRPFYSDTEHGSASGLQGNVVDTPGIYKYLQTATFRTCLICKDGVKGRIIGCVEWGYEAGKYTGGPNNGERYTEMLKPKFICGGGEMQEILKDTSRKWNESITGGNKAHDQQEVGINLTR